MVGKLKNIANAPMLHSSLNTLQYPLAHLQLYDDSESDEVLPVYLPFNFLPVKNKENHLRLSENLTSLKINAFRI